MLTVFTTAKLDEETLENTIGIYSGPEVTSSTLYS